MKLALRSICWTLTALSVLHVTIAQESSGLKATTYKGCFSSADGFEDQGSDTYQSYGKCQPLCVGLNKPVMALTGGSNCWCGDLLPVESSKTSDSQCGTGCQGYPDDKCGGDSTWSVLLTGLDNNVGSAEDSSSGSSSDSDPTPAPKPAVSPSSTSPATTPTSAAKSKPTVAAAPAAAAQPDTTKDKTPSTVTRAATVVVTAPGQTQPTATSAETQQPSKGPNTAGIVAGVVVGPAAIGAMAGGLFFFLRNRKRRAQEEQNQRNNAENPFETEIKPPPSSHSMSDSRLEPSVMMQRRQSDVSIADDQDYSRRILQVTNPDGS